MGFKPRALISNNHRSSNNNNNPTDPTTGRPQPIMAVGPSVFSSIPQFQQDPGRRGLNWGDAVANARWTSGLQYTSSRQTAGPSKLDLAVWAHERKSASTLAFKPSSTDFQSHDVEVNVVAGSGSRDSLRPEGSLPPLAPPRTYRNPLLPADNNGMEAMCRAAIHTGSSSSSSSPLTTLGGLASPTPPSPPSHAEPIPSSVGGASPLPPQQPHQYTASSSILLPLLRTPQTRPQPPPQQHSQQPSRSKAGAKRGASKAGGSSIGSVRSTSLGRHPIVVKSLEDTPSTSSAPVLWNVTGLRGWCIERLIHTTPQMSQGVLSRFLPPESSRVDSDTLRLHVASTSVAIQDIITKASCSSTSSLSMGVSSTGVKKAPTDTSKPSGLQLLDASALFVPGMPFNQQNPSNSNSLSKGALPAIPQQVPPNANGGRGMSLGSLLFPSPSSSQQVQSVPSLGSVQPANWERASNAPTLSELALENMGRREGMRKGVLERSAGGGGGGGGIKTSIFSDTPFTSTRPLHSALVTRALRELEAMSEAGLTMLDGGASAGRARALAACHSFLVPSAETLSVSVLGVLWVLENDFDVRCKSLQRSLAEVLTSQFMSSLCGGEDGDTPHTKPRRRTTGKLKPTKLQDLKFNELVRRDTTFYARDVVAADTSVTPPPPPAQDADDTTNPASNSSPKRAKVRAPLVTLTQDKYLRESEACLFGVMPAARVDVRWVVSLFDKYLNDHLSPKTPTRLSVPTPKIHNSYKCLASIFAQFDISRRRCVKTSSLRDVKTQSVSVRVRDSGTSSNGTHKQDIIAHAISRVEAMYKVMSGMPRPDRGVYLSAYGHAPLAEGEGGPSSLVPLTGRDAPDINQPSASPTTAAASTTASSSIPRTRLPSRRALTALLYLFQQVYPVCTTTCSEEQFIASYVAGSYFEASTCTTSTNVDVDGEGQKVDKGGDDGGDAEQGSDVVASSSPKSKKGSVFILPNSANTTNKSSSPIDVTFVKTVEYYAADIAAHWLEGGGQNSVRAVASRLNSHHGGSSSSVSSKPPIINKDMLVSIMGDPGAVKRAPKGALGDDGGSNMKPKHTLPPPPLPSTIMPQSPEASSLRQLPAVLLSAFTSDIIKHIIQEEYGYDGDELLPQVVELDWIVS